ncbi:hypothetical protein DPMN_173109 [Dreissena polymorpha]|uniref:Uncharacterized protein n=1 Tax=Dreissena polymorpha TaxID=45954 RepID=A0A9D4E4G3_DREPO|nr:hypothetical protein DPMN_173109 [Dreissena polymorpha]
MNTSTEQTRNGIHLTLWTQLEDLDFADDLAFFLSHTTTDAGKDNYGSDQLS